MTHVPAGYVRHALALAQRGVTYAWRFNVLRVIDGDTIACTYDLGGGIMIGPVVDVYISHVRLLGVDAPELGTPEGDAARDSCIALLPTGTHGSLAWSALDGRGRVLGRLVTDAGVDVISEGQAAGWLRPYTGRGPKPWA